MSDIDTQIRELREFHAQATERGSRYVTLLLAAGFAAFFTEWSGFRPRLSREIILLTGGMMGVSLLAFMGFEILKAFHLSMQTLRMNEALDGVTAENFAGRMVAEKALADREMALQGRIWPGVFILTVAAGMGAAAILTVAGLFGAAGLLRTACA
jgi:hypothetical protein